MTKLACLILAMLMLGLSACNATTPETTAGTTAPTEITQPPEEANVFKALLIGQSLGQDTVWLLQQVLKTEMPDQEFLVADIYLSIGLDTHRKNIEENAAVYDYAKIDDNGVKQLKNISIEMALKDEMWDLIIFNDTTYYTTQPAEFQDGDHAFMINYIKETAHPGYKLAYNATWANPTSELLWKSDRRDVPGNVHERFAKEFGGSRNEYYNRICENIKTYIETDEAYDFVFHTGTAMQYASETHGVPEGAPDHNYELYRDYVHASDFGRLLVAYQLYAQIYGLDKLEAVNVNKIEAKMRFTSEQKYGDLEITQQHKDAIIASVNYALEHPNEVPPQTAREPAFLERPDLMPAQS
ncbi:MAG: DUF4886 domain-containing protein [Oscillospiraceae bacterium]|nr:DUF4886 domain-containing protein [Oscillospiraceae bacterium]